MTGSSRSDRGLWVPRRSLDVDRRSLLKGLAALGALGTVPGLATACGEGGSGGGGGGSATATSLGSNFSDAVPKKALAAVIQAFTQQEGIDVDVNTVDHEDFQENITTYLQGSPDDTLAWFAGYRMQYFAAQGYLSPIDSVWDDIGDGYTDAFKQASTGEDGKLYFVPFYYYPWAVFYRKSVWKKHGYEIPTTLDEFTALCQQMKSDGLIPLGFADKEGWPALGTFDVLNFRQNGYQFHVDLLAGKESWDSDEVRAVFSTWADLMPYQEANPLDRDWLDSAAKLVSGETGMYYLGMFVGQAFTNDKDREDLDFFPFPEINPDFGTDTIDAPIDGWLMSADPSSEEAATKLLTYFGGGEAQNIYLGLDPNNVAANSEADTSDYNSLQKKAAELVGQTDNICQFLDRDTDPTFASNVMISAIQDFLNNPSKIDSITSSIEEQAKTIFNK